jgi:hypothetical protein
MKEPLKLFFALILFPFMAEAQTYLISGGPRSVSLGQASVVLQDVNAAFYNQAGLADLKNTAVSVFSENRFLVKELATHAIAVAIPAQKTGVFAVDASYFGYNLFNRKKIGLAYAKRMAKNISAGIQLDYFSTSIAEGYGTASAFTIEMGVQSQLTEKLTAATHIFNPIRAKLADYNSEKIPSVIRLGLGYKFNEKVLVNVESAKDLDAQFTFRAGLEYHVVKPVYVRAGINSNPSLPSFGFGFLLGNFTFDFAASYHSVLGYSPVVGIKYGIGQ